MLILLPPSEGKSAPRRGKPLDSSSLSFPDLTEPRAEMLSALVELCRADGESGREKAAETLGLGRTQADEVDRNAALPEAPTARADHVYSGVLYDALGITDLDAAAKRRATQWLAITSSLFGLVRPSDRIPSYRLAGGVALPGIGPVATYWSRHLEPSVLEATGRGLVVDLRSSTYVPFWRPNAASSTRMVSMRVLHEVGGTRKVVSHFNKATKGRIVRALLEDGGTPTTPARFAEQLGDLGWKVEIGEPSRKGTQLDVIVAEL